MSDNIVDFSVSGVNAFASRCEGALDDINKAKFNPIWTAKRLIEGMPYKIEQAQKSLELLLNEQKALEEVQRRNERAIQNAARAEEVYKRRAEEARSRARELKRARERAANSTDANGNAPDLSSYDSAIQSAYDRAEAYDRAALQAYEDKCQYESNQYEITDMLREYGIAKQDLDEFMRKASSWASEASHSLSECEARCAASEREIKNCISMVPEIKAKGESIIRSFERAMTILHASDSSSYDVCQTMGVQRFSSTSSALATQTSEAMDYLGDAAKHLSSALNDYQSQLTVEAGRQVQGAFDEIQKIEDMLKGAGSYSKETYQNMRSYLSIEP